MEYLTDSFTPNPVLLSNAEVMELLQDIVPNHQRRLAKLQENWSEKQKEQNNNNNRKTRKTTTKNSSVVLRNKFEHRDWIETKVLDYLKQTPCVQIPTLHIAELYSKCTGKSHRVNKTGIARQMHNNATTATSNTSLSSYGLTDAETVQILNFMPQEPVEIHLMIEDLHARMTESQQEEFLAMIQSYKKRESNEHVDPSVDDEDKEEEEDDDNINDSNNKKKVDVRTRIKCEDEDEE